MSPRKRPSQELNSVCDTLRAHRGITGRMAKPNQKANMTSNAVADCAKARQVDEEALFKSGGERIIEVGSLCESPQFLSDLRSLRNEAEEIGQNPESRFYAILKVRRWISH
jgi:hypothetical protein